jgi:demethylmenaquinone methyltransferase / 2-methoxy-6-polyprenyl-1,4-benzoquinol methylase
MTNDRKAPSKHESWRMFNRIARRYDLLNRLLSFGQDIRWRNRLAAMLPGQSVTEVLDLATGTGDLLLAMARSASGVEGFGLDMSADMLSIARRKIIGAQMENRLALVRADGIALPFADQSFHLTTIAFGIRNIPDYETAVREMRRVLHPGGRALILEFSLPSNRLLRASYLLYFRHILPRIGAIISGDSFAYRYLNQTVETFPYGNEFAELMRGAGFSEVRQHSLTFGVATIYEGIR